MGIPLAIYGSHDSSVCITPSPGKFRIYEFERLLRKRNCAITKEPDFREHMVYLRGLIETEYGFSSYGSCFFAQVPAEHRVILKEVFGFDHFEEISHHAAHAAGAVYQCDHEECLVISSDSGGHEMEGTIATFCIFLADKKKPMNHVIKKIADIPLDLAGAYTLMAVPIAEIQKTDAFTKYLTYAGKIMGLAAYGAIRMNWIEPLKRYYYGNINLDSLKRLGEEIGLNLSGINTLSGQPAYDLAATSQRVFEEITFTTIRPFVRKYQLPVVLTGGAALNVLLNEKFRKNLGRPVFVPINPNDCGLSFGLMALREPPEGAVDLTYMGFDILDRSDFADYIDRYNGRMSIPSDIAHLLKAGKTVGVMNRYSECGPRALGNRSIICDPSGAGKKDLINEKIKHREWFRPFAPVVKAEDVEKYFDFSGESRFMSYAPTVRTEYIDIIPAVVHKDATARVQTVTRAQNKFLYNLLDEFERISGIGVLLNTSLNIKGLPILTTLRDAFDVWNSTELDALYIEGWLFEKDRL